MSDMGVGHGRLYGHGQPLVGVPLAHESGLIQFVELPMRGIAQLPQLRPGQAPHGLQGTRVRHHIGIARRVPGADIGHRTRPVRPAKAIRASKHRGAAAVAAQPTGAGQHPCPAAS